MANEQTDLTMFTGKIKDLRIQATVVSDPTPTTGEIYINKYGGSKVCLYAVNAWQIINLTTQ